MVNGGTTLRPRGIRKSDLFCPRLPEAPKQKSHANELEWPGNGMGRPNQAPAPPLQIQF